MDVEPSSQVAACPCRLDRVASEGQQVAKLLPGIAEPHLHELGGRVVSGHPLEVLDPLSFLGNGLFSAAEAIVRLTGSHKSDA
jgi:hypothetical protein